MQRSDFFCRAATSWDPAEEIARLLHHTDPYNYPGICKDPANPELVDLISQCMQTEANIFHISNLSVIEHQNHIVGIACVIPCGCELNFLEHVRISESFRQKLHRVEGGYFAPLISESQEYEGYNIANICIDPGYRGKRLGSLLVAHCLETYGSQPIHLDVIAANTPAVRLYQSYGFQCVAEYSGFSGSSAALPCYHMLYTPTTAR